MRIKKLLSLLMLSMMFCSLTGCVKIYENLTVNPDGSITETTKSCILKEYADSSSYQPEPGEIVETLEDGKQYYTSTETATTTASQLNKEHSDLILNGDIFYYYVGLYEDAATANSELSQAIRSGMYLKMNITLLNDIVDTNANIAADTSGNTASFDTMAVTDVWYAYTAKGKQAIEADHTAPVITGVKNNKYYRYMPTTSCSDNICIDATKVILNGKPTAPDSITSRKEGKNTLTVSDLNGNSTSVTFYLDTKAPVIKGVKNNKIYKKQAVIYVKDKQMLSKVTDNKKNVKLAKKSLVKSGKYKGYYKITIKKKGKHTIIAKDSAGNKTTMKITIQ